METYEETLYTRFDHYLSGKMAEEEKTRLETEIETDQAVKTAFEGFLKSRHVAILAGSLHEKESLHEISTRAHQQRQQPTRTRNMWLGGALLAAVIALLIAVVTFADFGTSPDPSQIFVENFSLPDPPAHQGALTDSLMTHAHKAFEREEYQAAITLYESVEVDSLSAYSQSRRALFVGVSYLKIDQPHQARAYFSQMSQLQEYADWYTALSWLTDPADLSEAQKVFQQIADREGHHYQKRAIAILEVLAE